MARFLLLEGKHAQDEERLSDKGERRVVNCLYIAKLGNEADPKHNIVDTSRCVKASRNEAGKVVAWEKHDVDLCQKFNKNGTEKFRKLDEPEQQASKLSDDDLRRFALAALARGVITQEEVAKFQTSTVIDDAGESKQVVSAPSVPSASASTPHPILLSIAQTPKIGLLKIAEDEDIDISDCAGDEEGEWDVEAVRRKVKEALEARVKK